MRAQVKCYGNYVVPSGPGGIDGGGEGEDIESAAFIWQWAKMKIPCSFPDWTEGGSVDHMKSIFDGPHFVVNIYRRNYALLGGEPPMEWDYIGYAYAYRGNEREETYQASCNSGLLRGSCSHEFIDPVTGEETGTNGWFDVVIGPGFRPSHWRGGLGQAFNGIPLKRPHDELIFEIDFEHHMWGHAWDCCGFPIRFHGAGCCNHNCTSMQPGAQSEEVTFYDGTTHDLSHNEPFNVMEWRTSRSDGVGGLPLRYGGPHTWGRSSAWGNETWEKPKRCCGGLSSINNACINCSCPPGHPDACPDMVNYPVMPPPKFYVDDCTHGGGWSAPVPGMGGCANCRGGGGRIPHYVNMLYRFGPYGNPTTDKKDFNDNDLWDCPFPNDNTVRCCDPAAWGGEDGDCCFWGGDPAVCPQHETQIQNIFDSQRYEKVRDMFVNLGDIPKAGDQRGIPPDEDCNCQEDPSCCPVNEWGVGSYCVKEGQSHNSRWYCCPHGECVCVDGRYYDDIVGEMDHELIEERYCQGTASSPGKCCMYNMCRQDSTNPYMFCWPTTQDDCVYYPYTILPELKECFRTEFKIGCSCGDLSTRCACAGEPPPPPTISGACCIKCTYTRKPNAPWSIEYPDLYGKEFNTIHHGKCYIETKDLCGELGDDDVPNPIIPPDIPHFRYEDYIRKCTTVWTEDGECGTTNCKTGWWDPENPDIDI